MYPHPHHKTYRIGPFKTSEIEIIDLAKAWVAISIAFTILLRGQAVVALDYLYLFLIAALTVGLGFLFHELGHKFVAQRFGYFSEFRSFDNMLILAILMSFLGFLFAAPGAVMIGGQVDRIRNGKISAAGPIMNILIAIIFVNLFFFYPSKIFSYGFIINAWLALFNMIPIGNFDGRKILAWNKVVYGIMVAMSFSLVMVSFL